MTRRRLTWFDFIPWPRHPAERYEIPCGWHPIDVAKMLKIIARRGRRHQPFAKTQKGRKRREERQWRIAEKFDVENRA